MASAVRVGGERSYTRMRRGETAPPPPRTVRIDRLDVLEFDGERQQATVEVACSKGTYVRQIAADLGDATGAGGYCLELRRLTIGGFSVNDAGTLEQIAGDPDGPWHLTARHALAHMPERTLDDAELEHIRHGRPVPAHDERGPVRLVHDGDLVAIAAPGRRGLQPTSREDVQLARAGAGGRAGGRDRELRWRPSGTPAGDRANHRGRTRARPDRHRGHLRAPSNGRPAARAGAAGAVHAVPQAGAAGRAGNRRAGADPLRSRLLDARP